MKILSLILLLAASTSSHEVSATEFFRENLSILKIHPISSARPNSPQYQNLTRIYVTPGPWGTSSCRQDSGDLLKVDNHLLSVLLTAFSTGKMVDIYVEDTLVPTSPDTTCQITGVFIK